MAAIQYGALNQESAPTRVILMKNVYFGARLAFSVGGLIVSSLLTPVTFYKRSASSLSGRTADPSVPTAVRSSNAKEP
jgi:hypothetical protein